MIDFLVGVLLYSFVGLLVAAIAPEVFKHALRLRQPKRGWLGLLAGALWPLSVAVAIVASFLFMVFGDES